MERTRFKGKGRPNPPAPTHTSPQAGGGSGKGRGTGGEGRGRGKVQSRRHRARLREIADWLIVGTFPTLAAANLWAIHHSWIGEGEWDTILDNGQYCVVVPGKEA